MSTNPRQTLNQRTLLSIQSAANSPVAASKLLPMSEFTIQPQAEFSQTRSLGKRIHDMVNPIKEWTTVSVAGKADYNDLTYWLAMMFNYAAPAGSDESTWTFESNMTCRDTSKMASIWKGDGCVRNDFLHDAEVQSMSLTFGRNEISKSLTLFGRELEHGVTQLSLAITGAPTGGTFTITYNSHATAAIAYNATAAAVQAALVALADFETDQIECVGGALPSAAVTIFVKQLDAQAASSFTTTDSLTGGTTPASAIAAITETELAKKEILPGHVSVYFADEQADLDAAVAAVRNMSVTFNYNNKKTPLYVLNSTYGNGYKEAIETPADITLSFTVAADSEGEAFIETMRDGSTKFMRIEAVGPVIGTDMGGTSTKNYTYTGDFAFQINTAPSLEDMEGLYANTYGGVIVDDATWGKGYSQILINAVDVV